ncbi:hypothetical protein [Cyclobacterium xiamenense]|uniref:hypothetical protein n=1 Tax=Cyclobacterium xiamenense TaxID=1297121 RepID=UPI0035CEB7A1
MPKENGDLVIDANEPVTRKYQLLIGSLITDLGFPEKSTAFLETTEDLSYLSNAFDTCTEIRPFDR